MIPKNLELCAIMNILFCRSHAKLISKEEHEPIRAFESGGKTVSGGPIPHDHDFCKRIFINVSSIYQ